MLGASVKSHGYFGTIKARTGLSMSVFYARHAALSELIIVEGQPLSFDGVPYKLPDIARQAFKLKRIPDGMPFILDTDGHYKNLINSFLLSLASTSPRTWRGYAYDLRQFETFLLTETACSDLSEAGSEEFDLFFRKRNIYERFDEEKTTIGRATWRRQLAALTRFYEWLSGQTGHADAFRIRRGAKRRYYQRHITRGGANTSVQRGTIKSISMEDYKIFRDKGLRQLGGDASQTMLRNLAFAEFAVTTGVRLAENTAILLDELPDAAAKDKFKALNLDMNLGQRTTKGERSRRVLVPRRVLKDYIRPYLREERNGSIGRALYFDRYAEQASFLRTKSADGESCLLESPAGWKRRRYDRLDIQKRKLMFTTEDPKFALAPCMLWLQESGLPAATSCFSAVFRRASVFLEKEHGHRIHVSPHTLRHTFAIYKLTQLIEATCESLDNLRQESRKLSPGAYGQLIADPLQVLQGLLGHASQATTRVYLTYVEQADEIVDGAIRSWAELGSEYIADAISSGPPP